MSGQVQCLDSSVRCNPDSNRKTNMNHKRPCYMVRPVDGIEPTIYGWAAPEPTALKVPVSPSQSLGGQRIFSRYQIICRGRKMPTLQEKNGLYERPFHVVSAFLWDRYVVTNLHLCAVCNMIPVCHEPVLCKQRVVVCVRAGVEVFVYHACTFVSMCA